MNAPKCPFCGAKHWSYEPHVLRIGPEGTRLDKPVKLPPLRVTKPVTKVPETVTIIPPSVTKLAEPRYETPASVTKVPGRPKVHASNAARQRAYRARLVK